MSNSLLAVVATLVTNTTKKSSGEVFIPASLIIGLLVVVMVICVIVGIWKILQKAGENGWKAIIPFYGEYALFKIFWEKKWFWISLIPRLLSFVGVFVLLTTLTHLILASGGVFAGGLLSIIGIAFVADPSAPESVLSGYDSFVSKTASEIEEARIVLCVWSAVLVLCLLSEFVLKVISKNKISKAFGKGVGFTVGLVLLAPVFYMILGCGKAEYQKSSENQSGETNSIPTSEALMVDQQKKAV